MARGGERERSRYTVINNWKQGKNCPEFSTLYLPSTFSVVPVVLTLFVLERTLLLSYSTVLTNTSLSSLNSKSPLFFFQNQEKILSQNCKGVVSEGHSSSWWWQYIKMSIRSHTKHHITNVGAHLLSCKIPNRQAVSHEEKPEDLK